ncbi:GGDEF domain-containing protein [Aureimonas flava]|uniref:diguanylate cyclase n=1 Tax=Aureimonas flava TaxID=2320271 RepID=A0A3A1WPJ1_9HYPH|nr:GGDEF domain-containing protein [Aureimonas flava]RIY02692.1 GGDEF domain-containing protein [Aureimonas flava]
MTFKLQRIMHAGVAATLAACLLLTAVVVVWNLSAFRRHERALDQFDRFALSVRLMAATSAERGPVNRLLDGPSPSGPDAASHLVEARAQVDDLFDTLTRRFETELGSSIALREDAQALREALAEGRRAVDRRVAAAHDAHDPAETIAAFRAMFAATDRAQRLRDGVGRVLIELSPELTPLLTAVVAVSDLREYAGRLGSMVVLRIDAGPDTGETPIDEELESEFDAMLSLTDSLYRQIENYAVPFIADPDVDRAMTAVTFGYFTNTRDYAETAFGILRDGGTVGFRAFNDRYGPGMRTTETLREKILDVAHDKLIAQRERSLNLASASCVGAVLGGLVVLATLAMFERGVFRPLLMARQRMARILEGDLAAAGAGPVNSFVELTQLDDDIEKLRRQQIDLRRLEREREALAQELKTLATTDPLTGIMNRRAFEERVAATFADPGALGLGLGIVMIDLDHFKSINDRFGHGVGDAVLRAIGRFLLQVLPPGGCVARFGGEEFVMALADTGPIELRRHAETLRAELEATPILAEPRLRVTASFGLHWVPAGGRLDWDEFHRVADGHLYEAKRSGRNRVVADA